MMSYLSLEIRRSVRDRRYLLLVIGWPVGAYLLFSTVFGNQPSRDGLPTATALMVAMATFGAFGAVLTATGPRLAAERGSGWLRQLKLTPLSPAGVLGARLVAAMSLTLPAILVVFAVAAAVKGVRMDAWRWPALALALCAGCVPFAAIGMVIGSVADGDGAQGLTMVVYLVMSALGGVWMPVSILPSYLQTVAHLLPSNRMAELGWRVATGHAPTLAAVAVLAAWLVGATLVAMLLSRRLAVRG